MPTAIPPKIDDHDDQAIARLPGFESEGPNWNKLLRALTSGVQDIEDVLDDLINKQAISTAEGDQLDNIGTIIDLARVIGQSDSGYSAALLGRAASIGADSGTAEQLIQLYVLLMEATKIYSTDLQPATFEMTAIADDDLDPPDTDVLSAVDDAKAAGVNVILQVGVSPEFLWGDVADADADGDIPASVNGFGDDADADGNGDILPGVGGGNFARAIP